MKKPVNKVCSVSAVRHIFMLAACVIAAGCTPVDTAPAFGEGKALEIRQGTTAGFEGLRIGLSNISETDYTSNSGEKKHGLVAVLVLFIKGVPPREKRFDVHAGDSAEMDKYTVYVQEIRGGSKGSVKLQVKASDQPAAQ